MLCGEESLPSASLFKSLQTLDILVSESGFQWAVRRVAVGDGRGRRTLRPIERTLRASPFLGGEGHWW